MRRIRTGLVLLSAAGMLVAAALAETNVEVTDIHLLCTGCVKAVGSALNGIEGVTGICNQTAKTVTITAPDDATARKGIEAPAAAGNHGRLETKAVHFPRESGATTGKVSSLTLTGIHNCCGACGKAIKTAVKKAPGVTGDAAKPKGDTFEVTGDYEATVLIRALHTDGFHVKVEKWSMKNIGSANQTGWSTPA
jgi:periplasmic mercuric ion binding protein